MRRALRIFSVSLITAGVVILLDAGLISRDKRGLWVWYRIVPERLEALRALLATT
jgi:DNA-binding transcriptional ArsR family regulator